MNEYIGTSSQSTDVAELRLLVVEDSENDTLLLVNYLEHSGFHLDWLRVDTEQAFRNALKRGWNVVISDFTMPNFSGAKALEILRKHDPDIPFIFVSGTIGEITAVDGMKAGAQDYVMKDNLMRLVPALHRELAEAELRGQRRVAEQSLRKLSMVVEQATDSVFITDPQGLIEYVNPAFERLTGYSAEEAIGHTPALIKSNAHNDPFFKEMWDTILAGNPFHHTFINLRKDGSLFYEEKLITPLVDNEKHISHFVSTGRDVTDKVQGEEARARLLAILEATTDFVAIFDVDGRLCYLNQAGRSLMKLSPSAEANVLNIGNILPHFGMKQLWSDILPIARRDGIWQGETTLREWAGRLIPVSQVVITHKDEKGGVAFYSTIARDISERKRFEEELRRRTTHDALTELPNRLLLGEFLATELGRAKRQHTFVAVLFLNTDNFKRINDSLGHVAGDGLLKMVAQRLSDCVRPNDIVGRYGGDEFTIVFTDLASIEEVMVITHKLREAFNVPFVILQQDLYISFSTGISMYPNDGDDAETLLKNADAAMYRAKGSGRNQYQFYTPAMNAQGQKLLTLETDLRRALERGEFLLYYQPQLEFNTGRVVGLEALIRWQHPEHGLMSPMDFVPMLEELGLIVPVGVWVLHEACKCYQRCIKAGLPPLRVSVNVSALQFRDRELVTLIQQVLMENNVPPEHLELEITESILMQDVKITSEVLSDLDKLGVRLAVDDFGTGYSSLAYLTRFPLDVLKIDRTFIQDLLQDSNVKAIVEASISLGHKLGLEVVAEGVENAEQMIFLRDNECDLIQGYFSSKPLQVDEMMQFIADKSSHSG